MKRTLPVLILLLLVCSFATNAQSSQDLIGTWNVNYDATIDLMNSSIRAKYDTLGSSIQTQMRSEMSSQQFIFNGDNSFQAKVQSQSQTGNWSLEGKRLNIDFGNGAITKQTIQSISNSTMVLKIVDDASSQAIIHRISLTKSTN